MRMEIESEINRIYERDGELRPSMVVKEARVKKNPLHSEFEWDDKKASVQYRLEQARRLIRKVVVHVEEGGVTEKQNVYVHVPSDSREEGIYVTSAVLASDQILFVRAHREALEKLNSAASAVHQLESIANKDKIPGDKLSLISMADKALDTAQTAIRKLVA